jgi:hypothetical protein
MLADVALPCMKGHLPPELVFFGSISHSLAAFSTEWDVCPRTVDHSSMSEDDQKTAVMKTIALMADFAVREAINSIISEAFSCVFFRERYSYEGGSCRN